MSGACALCVQASEHWARLGNWGVERTRVMSLRGRTRPNLQCSWQIARVHSATLGLTSGLLAAG